MARYRNAPALLAFAMLMVLGYPVRGQVFVHTLLDRPSQPVPTDAVIDAMSVLSAGNKTRLKAFAKLDKDKITDADIDTALGGLSLPTTTAQEAQAMCDHVAKPLTNEWLPVRWSSERSACLWSQQSLDFAKEAQIVGGGSQGTASVEIASDVFWGLRVR